MFPGPDRRDFLRVLLCGTATLAAPAAAFARQRPVSGVRREPVDAPGVVPERPDGHRAALSMHPLGQNLIQISGAGGNVLVLAGADRVVMVNGGLRERSADVLEMIAGQTGGRPVHTLFNTDWHPEHTGANEALGRSGTEILAHENTRQYLGAELFVEWQNRTYTPLPQKAQPTQSFYGSGAMTAGAERIEYGHLGQAHTDGDIYVFFRDSNVLAAGDVLSVGRYPIADYTTGGWLGGLLTATKTLLDLANPDTRVVPGTGPVQTRADLQAQHDMLQTLRERLVKMMRQGMGAREMVAAGATKEFDLTWGNPELFVETAYRGLWLHVRELGGIV